MFIIGDTAPLISTGVSSMSSMRPDARSGFCSIRVSFIVRAPERRPDDPEHAEHREAEHEESRRGAQDGRLRRLVREVRATISST